VPCPSTMFSSKTITDAEAAALFGGEVLASVILERLAGEPNGLGDSLFGNPFTPLHGDTRPYRH
jgi:hypothetical protein